MAVRQVVSGEWQDAQGNAIALGRVVFEASADAQLSSSAGELSAGIKGFLTLDNTGSVAASPAQYMWPNDQMNPSNVTYTVWVYAADGQLAWGPNYGLVVPSGAGSFDLDTWVPNQIGSGSGATAGSLTLQTNGVNNGSQQLLNLENGAGITITDDGSGGITIASGGSTKGPRPSVANWHYYNMIDGAPTGFGTTPQAGIVITNDNSSGVTVSEQASTATEPIYKVITSSALANHIAGFSTDDGSVNGDITLGLMTDCQMLVQTPTAAHARYWVCALTSYPTAPVNSGFFSSDQPNVDISGYSCIGFRHSTAAGDTNWQCYAGGTAGTKTVVDSGVPIDNSSVGHLFELQQTVAGTVLFFIDGVQVASISTTLPALSLGQDLCLAADNVGNASSVVVRCAYLYWESSK